MGGDLHIYIVVMSRVVYISHHGKQCCRWHDHSLLIVSSDTSAKGKALNMDAYPLSSIRIDMKGSKLVVW